MRHHYVEADCFLPRVTRGLTLLEEIRSRPAPDLSSVRPEVRRMIEEGSRRIREAGMRRRPTPRRDEPPDRLHWSEMEDGHVD